MKKVSILLFLMLLVIVSHEAVTAENSLRKIMPLEDQAQLCRVNGQCTSIQNVLKKIKVTHGLMEYHLAKQMIYNTLNNFPSSLWYYKAGQHEHPPQLLMWCAPYRQLYLVKTF